MISEKTKPEEAAQTESDGLEQEEKVLLASSSFEDMDWWPGLTDIDRINILSSPLRTGSLACLQIFARSD